MYDNRIYLREGRAILRKYRDLVQRTDALHAEIEQLNADAYALKGYSTDERVQCSPKTQDKIGESIAKIDTKAEQLMALYAELIARKTEIMEHIYLVTDPTERAVLIARYCQAKPWDEVADELNISLRWAHLLEVRGATEVGENLIEDAEKSA